MELIAFKSQTAQHTHIKNLVWEEVQMDNVHSFQLQTQRHPWEHVYISKNVP